MPDLIHTKHPQKGRTGTEISKKKYDIIRAAITEVLAIRSPLTKDQLIKEVEMRLARTGFDGDIGWYTTTVRLDLEARRVVREIEGETPKKYELWPEVNIQALLAE